MPVTLKDFLNLRPAEAKLVNWLRAGNRDVCVISPDLPPENAPDDVRLRASFIRYLALGGCDACRPSEKGLRVAGAYIEGDGPEWAETRGLDLEGGRLPGDLGLIACRFPDLVLLRGAEGRDFYLSGSHLMAGFSADRLEANGGFFLRDVSASGEVRLLGAKLGGDLDATGATFTAVGDGDAFSADGVEAKGNVFLRGVTATGEVRLLGAKLGGDLEATGATFAAVGEGDAFSADRLEAAGGVFLRNVNATGEVRLLGGKLGGNLEATGATFTAVGAGDAFSADRLEATGGVFLNGTTATGLVRLLGTKLGGDLNAVGATFTAVGEGVAFGADGLQANGGVFLGGVTATGEVRLLGANLGGNLDATGATFAAVRKGRALGADGMEVGGSVFLRGVQAEGRVGFPAARIELSLQTDDETLLSGTLSLTAARIGELVDHPGSWPKVITLDRCRYGAFVGSAPTDAESRIRWLSLQEDPNQPGMFHPQPWEECARALREAGHSGAARTILIEKERRQRKAKRTRVWQALEAARQERDSAARPLGFTPGSDRVVTLWWQLLFHRLWDAILGAVVGYGRKPQNAAIWLGGFWLVGAVIFGHAGGHGAIKPNDPKIQIEAIWRDCYASEGHRTQYDCFMEEAEETAYPKFNALVYSADALLPVISFEMQSYWLPDDRTVRGLWVRRYLWLHIAIGWALTLLAVAGFSGLVKNDSK